MCNTLQNPHPMVLWCRISLGANRRHFETRPRSRVQNSKVGLVAFPAAACFLQGRDHEERQEDLLQSFGGQKWENHVSIENDVSNGKYWMEMIYPMEHDVSIGSPFLKLDGNGLHSAHVSNKKTPNSTGPLMRIDPRPEQPHFFMFSISTHFHPEDAIAWEWSGWKQHPDDDNDGHSPL